VRCFIDPRYSTLTATSSEWQRRNTVQRPNVIVILADDMGYGDFARFNGSASSTPVLDQLMSDGLTFAQHYSASPVCAPARAALLTGRYPQRTGVIDTLEARGTDRLSLRETTIADEFSAAGYRTGLIGKWHNGAIDPRYHPTARGFDEFIGFRGGWQDYWDWRIERNGTPLRADGRYLTDVLADEAVDFLRRTSAQPFLLHVAFNAPHYPFQAREGDVEVFRQDGRSETVATIYAMIAAMDSGIGRILETLDTLKIADNTIVIFTSDNGPQLDRTGDSSADRFNLGLSGEKLFVWEGGIRLPLIVRWPAGVRPGTTSDAFLHSTDWFPTLLDLAGIRRRSTAPLDGRSVAASIRGDAPLGDDGERFWQWTRYAPTARSNAAMRKNHWKLVFPAIEGTLGVEQRDQRIDEEIKAHPERFTRVRNESVPDYVDLVHPAPQLFDLHSDPGEQVDLADRHPELVRSMSARLASWFEEVEAERRSITDLSIAFPHDTALLKS